MTATPAPGRLSLWAATAPPAPLPGSVIAAVLAFGDIAEPQPEGLTLIRISDERLRREDVRMLLDAEESERARQVAILWDARRMDLVRVLDAAPAVGADRRLHGFPRLLERAA